MAKSIKNDLWEGWKSIFARCLISSPPSIGCHELKFVVHLALLLGGSTKFLNHKSCSWGISTNIFTFFMHHWLQTSWINDKKYHHHREFSKLRPARNRVTNCPSARRAFSLEYSLEKYLGIGWGWGVSDFSIHLKGYLESTADKTEDWQTPQSYETSKSTVWLLRLAVHITCCIETVDWLEAFSNKRVTDLRKVHFQESFQVSIVSRGFCRPKNVMNSEAVKNIPKQICRSKRSFAANGTIIIFLRGATRIANVHANGIMETLGNWMLRITESKHFEKCKFPRWQIIAVTMTFVMMWTA